MAMAMAKAAASCFSPLCSSHSTHTARPSVLSLHLPSPSSLQFAHCSASHFGLLSLPKRRLFPKNAVRAISPDFYQIPYTEGIPVGSKLKLYNLPYNCDRQALIDYFGTCDAVVESLEITNNPEEEGNASGTVVLGSLDQACMAVAQLDGARFHGKCVRMDFVEKRPHDNNYNSKPRTTSRNKPNSMSPPSSPNKIYIGNLPWRVDDTGLQQLFSAHGTVQDGWVMKDRENGRSRGFGFIVMSSASEMEKAIAALDGSEIEGRSLKVNVAASRDASRS